MQILAYSVSSPAPGMDHSDDTLKPKTRRLQGAMAGSGSSLQEALYGLAGGIAFGFVSPCIGHPFDTVKTRMQVDAAYHNKTFSQTVRQIYRSEGILRGFYRGFIPPLFGSMAFRGLLFSTYSGSYSACEKVAVLRDPIPYSGGLHPSVLIGAFSAAVVRAVIESPLDFMKVRYMVAEKQGKAHILQDQGAESLKSSLRHPLQTLRHLYHGFTPTLLRTLGLVGSFFVMVDYSVRYIPEVVNAPMIGPFFKGGICATTAWVFAVSNDQSVSIRSLLWLCFQAGFRVKSIYSMCGAFERASVLNQSCFPSLSHVSFPLNRQSRSYRQTHRGSTRKCRMQLGVY
jgi:hypothetical protein